MEFGGMTKGSIKRAAAAVAAAVMAASSVTGCASSTDYSLTANGKKINAGVYINYILNEMTSQMYQMYYTGEITSMKDCLTKEVEGKDFMTYVKDEALKDTKEFAAVQAKFDELGLTLSDSDVETIAKSVSDSWGSQKDFYEFEGVSRESLQMCGEHTYKKDTIFAHLYFEGGTDAVSDEELQNYVNSNYVRYKLLTISKSSEEDEEAKNKENEELKTLWEQYIYEAESVGMDFVGFDKVIDEYNAYKEQKAAEKEAAEAAASDADELTEADLDGSEQVIDVDVPETNAAADESTESGEVTTAATTAAPAETSAEGETTTAAAETTTSAAETTPAETEAPAETTPAETEAPADTTAGEAETTPELISPAPDAEGETEEEPDPYANETVSNYTDSTDPESNYYTESYATLLKEIYNTEIGKVGKYETDDYYYVFIRADVSERTDYTADHHDTIIHKMKDKEFDQLVEGWIEAASIVVNEKAMKRYTVQEVYDRQEEYASKQK